MGLRTLSGQTHLRLFVLIDALGWKFLEGREFLSDTLPYRNPLRTVLGFSSGAIPTILTGLPPAQTGHWNLLYYDPKGSPFRWFSHFGFLPRVILDHRVTRKILKETGRHFLGLGKNFDCGVSPRLLPLFNWVERANIYERGGIGSTRSIFDDLEAEGIAYRVYSYHRWTDAEILARAARDLAQGAADFFFIYLSELDQLLHDQWAHPEPVDERLRWYAAHLQRLFEGARQRDPEATLAVFSDHGMTPVSERHDLVAEIKGLGLSMPEDYLAVYDSTMARFWFFSEHARKSIGECLRELPYGRILPDEELRGLGVFFPDHRYGEVVFLLNPGGLIANSDFNGPQWVPAGMHGYHPDDRYSDAVFLSNRRFCFPAGTIADVFRIMREGTG
ncbi:MAG TPA: alkaline phosphatase family protein [Terriglobia bacterium]|nr:alkaline phosphatase family protein [Terriglobia bacterium]